MAVANIGPRQIRLRSIVGTLVLVTGTGLGAWLIATDAARPWRLVVLPFFLFAALALLQAWEKV